MTMKLLEIVEKQWSTFLIGLVIGMIGLYFLLEIKNKCLIASDAKRERQKILSILLREVGR